MDCLRKRFNRFYRFSGGGAAHKNIEAPRSIHNGDARRLAFQSLATHSCFQTSNGMKKRENASQAGDKRKHPIHRWRGPPSPMGKAAIRGYRFSRYNAFPKGEGKEEAASPPKMKPTPPRCARQPLPREGARVDTPSFLWKEVPRRGGGWMGMAV